MRAAPDRCRSRVRPAVARALLVVVAAASSWIPVAGCGGGQAAVPDAAAEMGRVMSRAESFLTDYGRELSQGRTEGATLYSVSAALDPESRTVSGSESVLFTNRTPDTLPEVVFKVYASGAGAQSPVVVDKVEVDGHAVEADLDGSILTIEVPGAIPPGSDAFISFSFSEPVPAAGRDGSGGICAYRDGTFSLANFLPTVARHVDGTWDTRPTPEDGDANYFDCSYYMVSFEAPPEYVVAATGVGLESDGRSHLFAAGPVRDFEVQASSRYRSFERKAGPTTVTSYCFEEDSEAGKEALDFGCRALEEFSRQFGEYPYTHLNICEAPIEDYGMEYSAQVAIGSFLYDDPDYEEDLELTVAHEVCHQWWALGVGSDSIGAPWLDESLTSYCEVLYSLWQYGEEGENETLEELASLYTSAREDGVPDAPVELPVPGFESGDQYTAAVYGKGALFFDALMELMGPPAFERSLSGYYREKLFSNADAGDLLGAFRANSPDPSGVDALYERWIRELHGDEDVPPYEE